jgi:hypothetical protein
MGVGASGSVSASVVSIGCLGSSEAGRSATTTARDNSANRAEHSDGSAFIITGQKDVPHSSSSCHKFKRQYERIFSS